MAMESRTVPADPHLALTVSELLSALRSTVTGHPAFSNILVRGEVANIARPPSGVVYFTLTEASAQISCVLFRSANANLRFELREGLEVVIGGDVDVFPARGQVELIVRSIAPIGRGAYWLSFEQVRDRLAAEGLFDAARKRPLPRFPRVIGLVTSESGAAMHDVLAVLGRRYPVAEILVSPCLVQGDEAPASIEAALDRIAGRVDIAIVARGGGPMEDLWSFNEERVARAIAKFPAPVVSAVGHETDVTIADFVADVRAPTPSAAAELVSPDREELMAHLTVVAKRLELHVRDHLASLRQRLDSFSLAIRPETVARAARERRDRFMIVAESLRREAKRVLAGAKDRLRAIAAQLEAVSPMATIARGFAIVSRHDGVLLDHVEAVRPGDAITILVSDGTVEGVVSGTRRTTG